MRGIEALIGRRAARGERIKFLDRSVERRGLRMGIGAWGEGDSIFVALHPKGRRHEVAVEATARMAQWLE